MSDLDRAFEEIDEIEAIIDDARRLADPSRGVVCSRGCAPGCSHIAYLVEAEEEDGSSDPRANAG